MLLIYFLLGFLTLSNGVNIVQNLVPYANKLPTRNISQVDLVVVHFTEECDYAHARIDFELARYSDGTGNSGHFTLDRNGTIYQDVFLNHSAWHVIGENFDNPLVYNSRAIGIESVNIGRYPAWFDSRSQIPIEPWDDALIESLIGLINQLKAEVPTLKYISGHDLLDVSYMPSTDDPDCTLIRRKTDPGPMFPWSYVLDRVQLQFYAPHGQISYEPVKICNSTTPVIPVSDSVDVIQDLVPYVDKLPKRNINQVDLIVIHYTEECDLDAARETMRRPVFTDGAGVSAHYTIDRNGTVYQYVPHEREAYHVVGFNTRSIGIENVNIGGYPKANDDRMQWPHEPYTDDMLASIIGLVNQIKKEVKSIKYVSGHNDLDVKWIPSDNDPKCTFVRDKVDPGPMFPWATFLKAVNLPHYQPYGQVPLGVMYNCTPTKPPECAECPNGWVKSSMNCKCYSFAAFAYNWTQGKVNCQNTKGASLASIDSGFENSAILGIANKRTYYCDKLYIGLSRSNGVWSWINGDTSTYRNWAPGFPINDQNANCAIFVKSQGTWQNVACNTPQCYLCGNNR